MRVHRGLLALVLAAGIAARFHTWVVGRSLWNDEAAIALNLRDLSPAGLTRGLEFFQVAPIGWLLTEKALYEWLGAGERVLRLPSLVGAVAVLVFTALISYRILGRWAALLATALVAAAPMLIAYTGELKQYAVEAAAAVFLLWAGDALGDRLDRDRLRAAGLFSAGAAVAVAVSFPAVLVLAGVAGGLVLSLVTDGRRWGDAGLVAAAAVPALAVAGFLIVRRLSYPLVGNQREFFRDGMPDAGASPTDVAGWLPRAWQAFTANPLQLRYSLVVLVLVVAGLAALAMRGERRAAMMFGLTLVVAVVAAAVRGLPMVNRVALYLVAPVLILIAAGAEGLVRLAAPRRRRPGWSGHARRAAPVVAAAAVVALVAVPAADAAVERSVDPPSRDAIRDVFADVRPRLSPDDVIVLYWFNDKLGKWYAPRYGIDSYQRSGFRPAGGADCAEAGAVLVGKRRVWYLRGVQLSSDPPSYSAHVAADLARYGTIVEKRSFGPPSADPYPNQPGWMLVDLTLGPDPAPPHPPAEPRLGCLAISATTKVGR